MVHDIHGHHHFHRRKRIHEKHEPYPHPDKWKAFMDKLIYFVGVAGPVLTLPQVYKIWIIKNVAGLSLITWSTYLFMGFFWLAYGIMHKEKPIIMTYTLWIAVNSLIVAGTLIYR